ncbi:MAG: ASKHA domain-containing protein [Candidatus Bathyarchaeia archaeon]
MFEPEGRRVEVEAGCSIFKAALRGGVGIRTECGGKGVCGKCKVVVPNRKAVGKITKAETSYLTPNEIDSGYRLACQASLIEDSTVFIPEEGRIRARKIQMAGFERPVMLEPLVKKFYVTLAKPTLSDPKPDYERLIQALKERHGFGSLNIRHGVLKKLPSILRSADWHVTVTVWDSREIIAVEEGDTSSKILGLAIDIGTSKIVGCLVDLTTGKTLSLGFIENPQITYGEDIISRITTSASDEEKLKLLQQLLADGVNKVLEYVGIQANVAPQNVYEVTVVGNTVMHHFFLGINPKYVAVSPFTPAIRRPVNYRAEELGIKACPEGNVHVFPVIAGFVGADAVADVLASGICESRELSLLLDIGTNTEVFLGNSEDALCCSCASGPAFEGGHIKHGMKAVSGAVESVSIILEEDCKVSYRTVDNAAPIGLCGSAMIDVVAEMFKHGIVDERGSFNLNIKTPRLRKSDCGPEFVIVWKRHSGTGRDIVVTQKDIREIQLAKAAIFSGCWILMKRKNAKLKDVDQLLIAGSFGGFINPENARLIGLVPDVPNEKIRFVGNTALSGAKMALISAEARKKAEMLSRNIRYLELANDPDFPKEFADAAFIPHKYMERFPYVKSLLNGKKTKN